MKASQTETVIMLTCCALQSACYSPTGIVISFILAQFQGEVQTNLTVKRFLMCSAALCTYSAERIIYNFAFVALCGALQTHFHRRGRNGKRHLQRRFLRKRGAAGKAASCLYDPFCEKCVWSAPQSATNALYQKKFPLYLPRAQAEGIFDIPPLPLDFKMCYTGGKRCTQER